MRYPFPLTSIVLALSILTAPGADPARPDFSGRWELDAGKSEGLPPGTKQSMTVNQTGDRLEVETKITAGPLQGRTVHETFALDGKPAEFSPPMLGDAKVKKATRTASWSADGRGMDVSEESEVETSEGVDTFKGKRTWRLAEGGKALTIEIDIAGQKSAMKGKRVYLKQ